MNNFTISIIDNKIFFEIIKEIKLFSNFKVKYYQDLNLFLSTKSRENQIIVLFSDFSKKKKLNNIPAIFITKNSKLSITSPDMLNEKLMIPFNILDFEKKIISLIAREEFKKNSIIHLNDYIIDKNERKIKKNHLELQLSEKEINFLILFSESKDPLNRNLVLKKVWNYSEETETHTVETHIHRLRKKILEKFNDNNFIKNNNRGYFIWKKKHETLSLEIYFLLNIKNVSLSQKKEKEVLKEKNANLI